MGVVMFKATISITSWKARINSVGLTIYSLLKNCPDFHIVLVLSKAEFPNTIDELPKDLVTLQQSRSIEILWTMDNPRELKKLETFKTYPDIPSIFVDDDLYYTQNFAEELYQIWLTHKEQPISWIKLPFTYGCCMACTLFPPSIFEPVLTARIQHPKLHDDALFPLVFQSLKIPVIGLHTKFPGFFHDESSPMNGSTNMPGWTTMQTF